MLIFLYGPDDYRRVQKKRELLAEFRKKRSDIGLRAFDCAAAPKEWRDDFNEFTRSNSLFETAKLAILENAFENVEAKTLAKLLQPFAAAPGKEKTADSITILLSERDKPVKALAFLLEKPSLAQKFEALAGAEWSAFIAAEAKRLGVNLAPDAAKFLSEVYAGNSWALATELEKLAAWRPSTPIARADLNAFDLEAAPNYWMLLNGLKSPDARTRLTTLERLLAMNDAPAKIFNILASQWKEKTPQMAEFDFMVKSGKLEYEEALVELAIG